LLHLSNFAKVHRNFLLTNIRDYNIGMFEYFREMKNSSFIRLGSTLWQRDRFMRLSSGAAKRGLGSSGSTK